MGKLFFSRVTVLICLFATLSSHAQGGDNYCVFQALGKPMLNDSVVLAKGMFVYPGCFLTLNEGDKLLLADEEGVMYEINKKVTMPYDRISKYTKKEKQSPFTLAYLKYVWEKLWAREEKQNIGVVFRAPNYTKVIAPLDSVQVFMQEVPFVWEAAESNEMQYFYLQQEGSDEVTKLATNGDRIVVPVDGQLLKSGQSYRWAVTPEADLEVDVMQFHSFELMQKEAFEAKLKELNGARMEFMALGLSDEEIRQTFCEDQKLCFN